jgi:hypothetical protein
MFKDTFLICTICLYFHVCNAFVAPAGTSYVTSISGLKSHVSTTRCLLSQSRPKLRDFPGGMSMLSEPNNANKDTAKLGFLPIAVSKTLLRKRVILAAVILSFLFTFGSVMFRPLSYGIGALMAPVSWLSNLVRDYEIIRIINLALMALVSGTMDHAHLPQPAVSVLLPVHCAFLCVLPCWNRSQIRISVRSGGLHSFLPFSVYLNHIFSTPLSVIQYQKQ